MMLLPVGLLWWLLPEKSAARGLTTLLLLAINFGSLANFIPFVELDGYFMLSHALNMVELRKDSHQLWLNGLQHALLRKRTEVLRYAHRGRTIYRIYGFCSLIYTALFIGYMIFFYFTYVSVWIGHTAAMIVLPFALLLLLVFSKPVRNWITQKWFTGIKPQNVSSH
ncbi:MAG TPA: hypothetical protein VKR42_06355, partial [Ktedonobacteraceae bacterium]|nr:hypothetical protein [Ktedonobacteraceae bacterium]